MWLFMQTEHTLYDLLKSVPVQHTHFVTPGVAPTVQARHLFKLLMMLKQKNTTSLHNFMYLLS